MKVCGGFVGGNLLDLVLCVKNCRGLVATATVRVQSTVAVAHAVVEGVLQFFS